MKAVRHILCFLTLYAYAITAEVDPSLRVDIMNYVFSQPGWPALTRYKDLKIVVRWMGEEDRCFTVDDLLATGADGQIVDYDTVKYKTRQAHQFLSCQFARNLKLCYDYIFGAVDQCNNVDVPSESLKCVRMYLDMIGKVNAIQDRMLDMLSCIYQLSPKKFKQDLSIALTDFKRFYNNLNFDRKSLDKRYHDNTINDTEENMGNLIYSLGQFYDNFCLPISYAKKNGGISKVTEYIQGLDGQYPPLELVFYIKGFVSSEVDKILNEFNTGSLGFKYDSDSKTTRLMYSTIENLMDTEIEASDLSI